MASASGAQQVSQSEETPGIATASAAPQDLPQEERGGVVVAQREARSQFCSSHPQHQTEYFCNQDQLPICSRCVVEGHHKGHDVKTMEDKNRESVSQLELAMLEARETLWRLDKAEQVIKEAMAHSQVNSRKVVEQIRLHFQELHSLLQAREELLMELIREAAINSTKHFQDMMTPECKICREIFRFQGDKVPRLLVCGHTVCHQCLTRLPLDGRTLLCPFDRQPTEVGDSGVWGLKKNFALLELLEKLQSLQQTP